MIAETAPDAPIAGGPKRPILKMEGVSKRFPGVRALEDVHLEVGEREIHALLGENGAGKSTLLKILSGAQSADAGAIELFGEPIAFASPHDAQRAGVVTIYQEFTLAPDMSIAENVFIGREPGSRIFVSWRKLAAQTRAITDKIGLKRDPMTLVRDLSVAEQQLVEIARALSMRSRLIVMDEPTSALSEAEVANLAGIIRTLKAEGLSIIFVTHRLEEVFRLCDSLHGPARRAVRRRRRGRSDQRRRHHPDDGRARRRRALRRAPDSGAWPGRAGGRGTDAQAHRPRSPCDRARRRLAARAQGGDPRSGRPRRRGAHRDRAGDFRRRQV